MNPISILDHMVLYCFIYPPYVFFYCLGYLKRRNDQRGCLNSALEVLHTIHGEVKAIYI